MSAAQEGHEEAVAQALVDLADSLVEDYDVVDLLHRLATQCVKLLSIDAAGLLLTDQRGALRIVSSSAEHARVLELFEVEADEGPCLDCFRSSEQVTAIDPGQVRARWPSFAEQADQAGFQSVHALPLRLRTATIGALALFSAEPGALASRDLRIGQALADVATISILQERAVRRSEVLAEQLQAALNSRVLIEQAKGVLAEREQLNMDDAFKRLRRYARSHNARLTDVARKLVEGINP